MVFSVRPSHLFHYVPIIVSSWNFQELLPMTDVMSMQKVNVRGQRTRSQEVMAWLSRFRTVTRLNSNMMMKWCTKLDVAYIYRRGALLFSGSSVKFQGHSAKKSSILTQIGRFRTVTQVWIYQWLWNDAQSLKQYRRGALLIFKVICQISRSHGTKNCRVWPELSISGL